MKRLAFLAACAAIASVAVGDGEHDLSLMRFVPGDLEIKVGESVAFTNQDASQMPHTVTFRAGGPSPEMITLQPRPDGPPLLVFNPDVIEPRGAAWRVRCFWHYLHCLWCLGRGPARVIHAWSMLSGTMMPGRSVRC